MRKIITISFILLIINLLSAFSQLNTKSGIGGLMNLNPTTTSRIANTNKQWGTNFGDASICLWKDDKVAAFTITIDDNIETEVEYWKQTLDTYKLTATWFLITEAQTWADFDNMTATNANVKDWTKYTSAVSMGHCLGGHDDRNWYNTPSTPPNPDSLRYVTRLNATRQKIETQLAAQNHRALTYAYPYGEGNVNYARTQYIALRGTYGVLNSVDKVNYLNVNSVSSGNLVVAIPTYIDPLLDKNAKLYNVAYYRGWGSTHFHGLYTDDAKAKAVSLLQYIKAREDSLWIAGFTPVAQYAQSRDTHHLTTNVVSPTQVNFTLTDDMSDDMYFYPLTVKIKVANNWASAIATQNGTILNTKLITAGGNKYLLVNAVPDRGEVAVVGTLDSDPAIFNAIQDVSVDANDTKVVLFEAHTTQNTVLTFTFGTLPSFINYTIDGAFSGKLTISPAKDNIGQYTIVLMANNGVSTTSKSFVLTVNPDVNTLIIKANAADAGAYFPSGTYVDLNNRANVIAGGGYDDGKQLSAVFPFQLPAIPVGKIIKEAQFQVYLEGYNTPASITGTLNLYALAPRASSAVILADGYAGQYLTTNGTPLQETFATKTTPIGIVTTSLSGKTELTNDIKKAYTDGHAGKYYFLRISNTDVSQTKFARTIFTSTDGATTLVDNNRFPTLIITLEKDTQTNVTSPLNRIKPLVYPNPLLSETLTIELAEVINNEIITVELYDTNGILFQKKLVENQQQIKLNMAGLAPQIYILKCSSKSSNSTHQIIKL